jgi:hypothetical protein
MRTKLITTLCLAAGCLVARQASAAIAFPDPSDGWTYQFNGDQLNTTNPTTASAPSPYGAGTGVSFDGTWRFTGGGSDSFDGSTNGGTFVDGAFGVGNKPGGWTLCNEGGVTFVRMQDTGDPRTVGFHDPSNRKLMMARVMSLIDAASTTQLADGFTLCFRARVPTIPNTIYPIDPLFPASGGGPVPYPAGGDGYVTFDGGKGNITVHDGETPPGGFTEANGTLRGASIAFSLTQTNDNNGGSPLVVSSFAGLTMNELAGNAANNNVNFGQGSGTNLFPCDPTQWHEFWIVIKADPTGIGTHEAYIFADGNLTPKLIHLTAGGSSGQADFGGANTYITISSPSTGQSCALDVDFLTYKLSETYPAGAINLLPPAIVAITPFVGQPFYATSSNIVVRVDTFGTNSIPTTGAQLALNGSDVSGGLAATGTSQDRTFTYSSLVPNTIYNGQIIVSDQAGRATTNAFAFDTFLESSTTIIEGEDYNYQQGQFINDPAPNAYNGLVGTYKIDYLDQSLSTTAPVYRTGDAVDLDVTQDFPRPRFVTPGQTDYQVGGILLGEWLNYTRTFAAGRYKIYLRAASTVAQDVRLDLVTGSASVQNQTVKYLGTFHVPDTGSIVSYANVPLNDIPGNLLPISLSGTATLRLTAVSANNDLSLNYMVLAQAGIPAAPAVAATPAASETGVTPNKAIEAAIYDGSSAVDPTSVVLGVNGSTVLTGGTKSGSITSIKYTPSSLWPVLSSNFVTLAYSDGTARSNSWSFTVANLPSLTPAMKVNDAATNGFILRSFSNPDNQAALVLRAKLAMAGILTNSAGVVLTNLADPTFGIPPADGEGTPTTPTTGPVAFHIPTVINMSSGGPFGNFGPDDQWPGFSGAATADSSGLNADVTAFVQLPAGVTTMVIDSQDGFELNAGFINDSPLVLAHLDGQNGTGTDHVVPFIVQQAGVYAFHMYWFHVQHQYALEWEWVNADGSYGLINDTANTDQTGPAAFSSGTVPTTTRPTLTIQNIGGGQVKISWGAIGTLLSATSVGGPYSPVPGAVSPYTTSAVGATYYRVRVP